MRVTRVRSSLPVGMLCGLRRNANDLVVIDARTGAEQATTSREVPLSFAFALWTPAGHSLVYGDKKGLWRRDPDAKARKLAPPPAGGWSRLAPFGWSPGGRYLGLLDNGKILAFDRQTGLTTTLLRRRSDYVYLEAAWWRPPART